MNAKRILVVILIWGVVAGYPLVNGMSILAWLSTTIGGFVGPILGSGFAQFLPILSYGGSFAILFFVFDKIKATKSYSVPAAG